jgi:hypothetical protein
MPRLLPAILLTGLFAPFVMARSSAPEDRSWVARSNAYTQQLIDVSNRHSPENASAEGLAAYDTKISVLTQADQDEERAETEVVLKRLKASLSTEKDPRVLQDIHILISDTDRSFRRQDYERAHKVPFLNAPELVFSGLQGLLDDQTAPDRRRAAVVRLNKYAGIDAGSKPLTDLARTFVLARMDHPGVSFPSRLRMETELARNGNYIDGIADLFRKYKLTGWEPAYDRLKTELASYDAWQRASVLPRARTDFRLAPADYALSLEGYGVDLPPEKLAAQAHASFLAIQAEMAPLATAIARQHGFAATDYRSVLAELKRQQITGDAILPLYENRLHQIEGLITAHQIVTLPSRPAIIRLATAAETAQVPAPHMQPPPFLHNTGQRGVFILPLNLPAGDGAKAKVFDDFTYDAVAWTLTAHEARPGHELQFDSMVEQGVSLARALYAFNSTNAEGWGLYSEYLIKPYMPADGQLASLDLRLLRAARAFLDPELQAGKITPEAAKQILMQDVVLSDAFATSEVERYTIKSPGQANSYFYGYNRLLDLRRETEGALGSKFNALRFHDFILAQGLLPPDLMRKAVLDEFVPSQH